MQKIFHYSIMQLLLFVCNLLLTLTKITGLRHSTVCLSAR